MALVQIVVANIAGSPSVVGRWHYTLNLPMEDWDEDVMVCWVAWDEDEPDTNLPRYGHPLANGNQTDGTVEWK